MNTSGPRNAANTVSNPLKALSLFMPDGLLENVTQHKSEGIEHYYELFLSIHIILVDMADIKPYSDVFMYMVETKLIQLPSYLLP